MAEGSGINKTQIWVTVITVVGGLLTAIIVNADKWIVGDDTAAVSSTFSTTTSAQPASSGTSAASPAVTLAGEWRGEDGSRFRFTQSDSSYDYAHTAVDGTLLSTGKGTIAGRDLSHRFETPAGDSGTCTARVDAAASRMTGSCENQDGRWTFAIER